jgi:hypothetical protein
VSSTKTPNAVTPAILALCDQLSPGKRPTYITITPAKGSECGYCVQAVLAQTKLMGGRMQTGWAIWEWLGVFIEAEHHAVYEPPSGPRWIDLTPSQTPGESRRLFLPDDSARYEEGENALRHDNERRPLSPDPNVREFCQLAAERTRIMNTVGGFGLVSVSGVKAQQLLSIERRMLSLQADLVTRFTPRNSRCPCGSGRKYKVCCGR